MFVVPKARVVSFVIACLNQVVRTICFCALHGFSVAVSRMGWGDCSDAHRDAGLPMFKLLSSRRSLLVLTVSMVCAGVHPCLIQEYDRRI